MKPLIFLILTLPVLAEDAVPAGRAMSTMHAPRILPPEVRRGDRVAVTVWCGAVRLKFEAETESSGHIGETVIVRNPENGRRFVARVEQEGKVLVQK